MDINDIPFIELDLDIDYSKLLSEYREIESRYEFKGYKSNYFPVRKKYKNSWSGIGLISSNGELYSDMSENAPENLLFNRVRKDLPIYVLLD